MSDNDTPLSGGTENAQPSKENDTPETWDYYDPDEEVTDTVTPSDNKGTEGEANEDLEEVQEVAQSADEEDESEDADKEPEKTGEPKASRKVENSDLIVLPSGEEITVDEVRRGYLRQSDYSRKTLGLSEKANHITRTVDAIGRFLHENIPPPPDMRLSVTDPQSYLAQQVQHDAAVKQWQHIMQLADAPSQISDELQQEQQMQMQEEHKRQLAETLKTEYQKLIQRIPNLATQPERDAFRAKVLSVAQKAGVTAEEIDAIADHRYLVLLDYAVKGFASEKAQQVVKEKVATVPPVAPQKRIQQSTPATKNREAMRRLSSSGSIKDALMVDFD